MEHLILWACIALNVGSAVWSLVTQRRIRARAWEVSKAALGHERIIRNVWGLVDKFQQDAKQNPDAALSYRQAADRLTHALVYGRNTG